MTELEIMQRAREYVEKLAKGIDPITGREVPEGEVVNNVRVSRCLFYVADMLRKVIESGGVRAEREAAPARVMKRSEKAPFALSLEDRERYPFEDGSVTVSVIAHRLNEFVDQDAVQKLKTASITGYLMKNGLLAEEVKPDGTKTSAPRKRAGAWAPPLPRAQGCMEITPRSYTIGTPSSSSWITWTPSRPSTPRPFTRTRASPGHRRGMPG